MNRPTAMIFDFDGVIADTEPVSFEVYCALLKRHGKALTIDEYRTEFCGKTEKRNQRYLVERFGLPITPEESCRDYHDIEKGLFADGVSLKPEVGETLKRLEQAGVRLAVASSSTKSRAIEILAQNGIDADRWFETMVFAEDISRPKPAPDVFAEAARRLGVDPAQALVEEDSEAGIEAAHAAGIPVACIPDMKEPDKAHRSLCAAVLPSLGALANELL